MTGLECCFVVKLVVKDCFEVTVADLIGCFLGCCFDMVVVASADSASYFEALAAAVVV